MATCAIELVTPDQARKWLDFNHRNRSCSQGAIDRLAGVITRGEWFEDCTDGIGLDTDGGVVNGQHRLLAIIAADQPVHALVVRDVNPDVIKVIDQGKGRSFTQWLQMDGRYADPTQIAGSVVYLYRLIHGFEVSMPEGQKPTIPQLLDVLNEHKNIEASIEPAMAVFQKLRLNRPMLASYHYAFASVDPDAADDFFTRLANGEVLEGEPVHALRERYVRNMAASESAREKHNYVLGAWLVKAWEALRNNTQLKPNQIRWIKSGRGAEPYPRPYGVSFMPLLYQEDAA